MFELPANFESFDDQKKAGFLQLKAEKEKGKKVVGVFCSYTPVELILAAGAHFVSLCGSSDSAASAAERDLPKDLCPLIKASYGVAITDTCPYFYFSDALIGETTCDGKKKMYELLGKIKPMYVLHLPQVQEDEYSMNLWVAEMHRAKEFLEKQLDVTITDDDIRRAIRERNEMRRALLRLYDLGKLNPAPISGYEINALTEAADFHFTDDDLVATINRRVDEVLANYKPEQMKKKPRILVTGTPLGGAREKILVAIEELGANCVILDNCSGPRTQRNMVDETKDPYEALAEKYLAINCSVMTPNTHRFEELDDLIDAYEIDGVVEVVLHACHTFAIEAYQTRQFVTKEKNIPYLYIDTDFSTSDSGQVNTRLGAFIEMLS